MSEPIDFGALLDEMGPANQLMAAGDYDATIKSVDIKTSSNGKPGLNCKFAIDHGQYAGRSVYNTFWISKENPKAMNIFFRQMSVLGADASFMRQRPSMDQLAQQIQGKRCNIRIIHEKYLNEDQERVSGIVPAKSQAPAMAPGGGGGGAPAPSYGSAPSGPPAPTSAPPAPTQQAPAPQYAPPAPEAPQQPQQPQPQYADQPAPPAAQPPAQAQQTPPPQEAPTPPPPPQQHDTNVPPQEVPAQQNGQGTSEQQVPPPQPQQQYAPPQQEQQQEQQQQQQQQYQQQYQQPQQAPQQQQQGGYAPPPKAPF